MTVINHSVKNLVLLVDQGGDAVRRAQAMHAGAAGAADLGPAPKLFSGTAGYRCLAKLTTRSSQTAMRLPLDAYHECSSACEISNQAELVCFGGQSSGLGVFWTPNTDSIGRFEINFGDKTVSSPGVMVVCKATGCVHFCSTTEKCSLAATSKPGSFTCPLTHIMTDAPPSEAECNVFDRCTVRTKKTLHAAAFRRVLEPGISAACLRLCQLEQVRAIGNKHGAAPKAFFHSLACKIVAIFCLLRKFHMLQFLSAPVAALYFGSATLLAEGFVVQDGAVFMRVVTDNPALKTHLAACLPRARHRAITKMFCVVKDSLRQILATGGLSPHDLYLATTFPGLK